MRPLTILLDMDEIVVDMQPRWYALHNARTGDSVCVEKITDWDITRFTPHGKRIFEPIAEPGFYESLPPVLGAIDGVRSLLGAGHRVLLVSSAPNPESHKGKAAWVAARMPWFPTRDLVLTGAKDVVRGDVLFDDAPHNVVAYRKAWPRALIATIAFPYSTVEQLAACDLVAGDWRAPAECWHRFTDWIGARAA